MATTNTFTNSGSGPQNNNTGDGTQNNNTGSGTLIAGAAPKGSAQQDYDEIIRLKAELKKKAETPQEFEAMAKVAAAADAAKAGDSNKAITILKGAGKWVLDTAKDLTVKVGAEMIASSLGG